jgi:hypothetical protein
MLVASQHSSGAEPFVVVLVSLCLFAGVHSKLCRVVQHPRRFPRRFVMLAEGKNVFSLFHGWVFVL